MHLFSTLHSWSVSKTKTAAWDVRKSDLDNHEPEQQERVLGTPKLTGNFRPVHEVCREAVREGIVVVEGEVPSTLRGLFLRNGPNSVRTDVGQDYHLWDGDGMLHAVWFGGGDEVEIRYKNRYVETIGKRLEARVAPNSNKPLFDGMRTTKEGVLQTIALSMVKRFLPTSVFGLKQAEGTWGDTDVMIMKKNVANTAMVLHNGRILALWEAGLPYALDAGTLETIGPTSFGGALTRCMSAHPKIDPVTGEMIDVSYYLVSSPFCTVHVWSNEGDLVHKTEVQDIEDPVLMHDSAITENYTLILDLPLEFKMIFNALEPEKIANFGFNAEKQGRIGVLPRLGSSQNIKWFTVSPNYAFHTINAYEEDGKIVLHSLRLVDAQTGWDPLQDPESAVSKPHEYVLDMSTGEASERIVPCSDQFLEMPQINPNLLGRKAKYAFAGGYVTDNMRYTSCEKLDLESGNTTSLVYNLPEGCFAGEFAFAPKSSSSSPSSGDGSDNGWLVAYVHNEVADKSEVHVVNAETMQLACRIALPVRVPYGFHSTFITKDRLPDRYSLE